MHLRPTFLDTFRLKDKKVSTVETKGQIPAAFWPLFKNATFEFCKYESFVASIMPKTSSDGNFRPFCAFIDFLQMFKVGKFAS